MLFRSSLPPSAPSPSLQACTPELVGPQLEGLLAGVELRRRESGESEGRGGGRREGRRGLVEGSPRRSGAVATREETGGSEGGERAEGGVSEVEK